METVAAKCWVVERRFAWLSRSRRFAKDDDLVRLMAEEYTFVARPVIVRGGRATAGFTPKRLDAFIPAGS